MTVGAPGECLDDAVIAGLAAGQVAMRAEWEAHLADCAECRCVFAAAARGRAPAIATERDADAGEPAFDELGQGVVLGGRYELARFLGAGGMGVVWAARRTDTPDAGEVALKIARSADSTMAHRFEREARVAAAIAHPNVVVTLEVLPGVEGRGPCLVQELLEGETLDGRLRRGPLALAEAARTLAPVADAVAAAHARGILHRDLKPSNVFLTPGRPVVLDFGIAKLLPAWGPHSRITRSGVMLGTPGFMAPEQLFGEGEPDERADVWALGAMAYCALAGEPPIAVRSLGEAMAAYRRARWADLEERVPGLPDGVTALVRTALVVERERRMLGVGEIRDVLTRYA